MKSALFAASKQRVFDVCLQALGRLGWQVKTSDLAQGNIHAARTGNFLSFGHTLEVKINFEGSGTRVTVDSSSIGVQVIDWGTNAENEDQLINAIKSTLG